MTRPPSFAPLVDPRSRQSVEGAHECLLSLVPVGLPQEKALHFLETGPDCAHCRRARLVGFVSSTLVAIVILDVPFDVGGAMIRRSRLFSPEPLQDPVSCDARR